MAGGGGAVGGRAPSVTAGSGAGYGPSTADQTSLPQSTGTPGGGECGGAGGVTGSNAST